MDTRTDGTIEATSSNLLKHDGPAGLVVFLVALPLCLGIALGSGASLFSGVISGIVGGLFVSVLSGSQVSVSGPAAGLAVIVLTAIHDIGSYKGFLVAVVLSGLFQLAFGVLNLGVVADYVPNSVIKGMLAGVGLLIVLKQIPHVLGRDLDFMGDAKFLEAGGGNTLSNGFKAITSPVVGAVAIFLAGLALYLVWEYLGKKSRFFQLVPGPSGPLPMPVIANGLRDSQNMGFGKGSI